MKELSFLLHMKCLIYVLESSYQVKFKSVWLSLLIFITLKIVEETTPLPWTHQFANPSQGRNAPFLCCLIKLIWLTLFALLARNLEKQLCCQCEIVTSFKVVNYWPSLTFFSHEIYLAWNLHAFFWVGKLHVLSNKLASTYLIFIS